MLIMERPRLEQPNVERRLAAAAMYVRAHVDERLRLETIAAVAGFSPYHFHRIFRVAFGENLCAYVARHRLGRAARELRRSRQPITDIALCCGYESPSAFGRAFSRAFGMTPSAYRAAVVVAGPASPERVAGVDAGAPRIAESEPQAALGLDHRGPYDEVDPVVMRVLEIAQRRGFLPRASLVGLSYGSPDLADHAALRFEACVTVVPGADVAGARADGLRPLLIPGGTFAIYRHRGPFERITHLFDVLVAAWVLTGRVVLRDAPFAVTYASDPRRVSASELESDLAIPVA
jgi:AraC family transcriptional regulator